MFRSVFTKYLTAVMSIFTVGFAVLLLVVTSTVSHYSLETKLSVLRYAADAASFYFGQTLDAPTSENFPSLMRGITDGGGEDAFSTWIPSTVDGEDVSLWAFDTAGENAVSLSGGGDGSLTEALPEAVLLRLREEDGYSGRILLSDQKTRALCSAAVFRNENGEICGFLLAISPNVGWGNINGELTRSVISSCLLVLLAALIAVYFITERIVDPLHEMSVAARNFAAGKFDRRVIVRGKDEVAELSVAFNQMADSLETLEKMRSSFMANVSHDLRTPMTTIAGFIDGIREGVIPREEQDHYLEIVSMEVQRLSRLVSSLLDLSRIQAGDRKFSMKPFDIAEMARLILISFEKQIDEKHLEVEFDAPDEKVTVNADHDAIYQIFYNLCHNAIKFSTEGGVLRISIGENREKKIQVSVFNEGQGIPLEDQPYVFDRFYKADKSRGLDKSGVGLGLFIAKTIIEAHHEKIWLSGVPGESVTFYFTLPKAPHGLPHGGNETKSV